MLLIREAAHDQDSCNVKTVQAKQKRDCNNRYSNLSSTLNIGFKVILQNQKRKNRKVRKFSYKWMGQFIIKAITKTGLCTLANKIDKALRKKRNFRLLKPFFFENTIENDEQRQLQKSNRNEKHNKHEEEEEHIHEETFSEHELDQCELNRNYFNKLPDKIVEMILLFVEKSSEQILNFYHFLVKTYSRFNSIVKKRGADILPRISLKFHEKVLQKLSIQSSKIKTSFKNQSSRVTESVNLITDAVVQRCSVKKVFLKILQNSQENTCARVSFLIKLQA